jgi:hypothetical protein
LNADTSSILASMRTRFTYSTSAAAVLLAAVALVAAVKQLPSSLRSAQAQIETNASLTLTERELDAARANGVHQDLALRAAEILPRDAVFYVATSKGGQGTVAAPAFYAYWLLPRRRTNDVGNAGWIVNFGADPASLGVKADVVADLGGGAQVLKVRR